MVLLCMPATFHKKSSHLDKVLEDARCATAHGGQLIVDALAREFGLWEKIAAAPLLDPRRDKSRGFSPEAIVAQLVFSFCSGGVSLSDAGRLGSDKALGQLLGMERWAEETTIGEWLRAQSDVGLREFWSIIREFVGWSIKRAKPSRVRRNGELEVFFDDTQIEVQGRYFQGVEKNYEGNQAYSWQTLWVGPFLADAEWAAGNRDCSASLGSLLESTASIWENDAEQGTARFYADSGSSAGKYLNLLDERGWNWSVSYNKWTDGLDRLAAEMAEDQWSEPQEATGRNGEAIIEQYGWVRHLPGEQCERAQVFAVVRFKPKEGGDLFWRYAYVVGGGKVQSEQIATPQAAREVFVSHRFKGAKEQGFHQLLGDMDLHHPPCLSSSANAFYYAVGALAFNLLMAVKVQLLEDDQQAWTVRSLIRFWLTVPVKISSHAHRSRARIFVPKASMRWWRLFLQNHYPKRKPGRPAKVPEPRLVQSLT
jgi:hypothetical protein